MMRSLRRGGWTASAMCAVLCLMACTAPPARTGAPVAPATLKVIYGNTSASVGSDVIDSLTRNAASPIAFENVSPSVVPGAAAAADPEGDALEQLAVGGADITIVRAGRLALAGDRSLRVLEAPLVVSNDAQAKRIAVDPMTIRSTAGLGRLGLVALAVVPGSLRHLFGYSSAVTSPGTLAGTRVSTRPDAATSATIRALGAVPDLRVGAERGRAVATGDLRAIETSLDQPAAVDLPAVVASNLALYEKFDVLVMRKTAYGGLSTAQRTRLHDRVMVAVSAALGARVGEDASLAGWCGRPGASAVRLTAAQSERFHAVLDPVADGMATTPADRALLERMRALHDGTVDPSGTDCAGAAGATRKQLELTPIGSQTVLDGTWRTVVTEAALRAAGGDAQAVANNAGVWTFTIRAGLAEVVQPFGSPCTMRFVFSGDRVTLDMAAEGNDACGGFARGTYRRDGDTVRFIWVADVDGNPGFDEALFGTLTRTRP